ncbi:hypothetical protein L6452_36452 [Arctium lappa]|uniref:Uncharacterized protein n=1 Tax=Arctium lappa TaxID=4217 RepID=A0ACB8Y8M2_ARCLA|nr:hypothetical protein L6452_36452 [Arctium lappa]
MTALINFNILFLGRLSIFKISIRPTSPSSRFLFDFSISSTSLSLLNGHRFLLNGHRFLYSDMKGFYKQRKKNAGISKPSSTKSKSKPKNAVSFGSLNYSDPLIILHQIIRYLPNSP